MGKRNIGIIGNGVIGRQQEYFIRESHKGGEIEFSYFDDLMVTDGKPSSYPLMEFSDPGFINHEFYIGLGYKYTELKRSIADKLYLGSFQFPSIVHFSAYLHPTVEVGNGVFIFPMCNLGFDVRIGYGTIINKSCTIAHDSIIGKCNFLAPSVTFCGAVQVGDNCFIGAGTVVADNVRIGNNVTVGIGSVITHNIPDGITVIGNPARVVPKLNIR